MPPPTATAMGAFSPIGMCCGRGHGAHRARRTPRHAPHAPLHGPVLLRLPSLNTSRRPHAPCEREAHAHAQPLSCSGRCCTRAIVVTSGVAWARRSRALAHTALLSLHALGCASRARQCDPRPSRARALVSPVQASSSTLSPSAPSRPTLRPMVIPTTAAPTPPSPMPAHQLSRRRRRPRSRRRRSRSARSAKHPSPPPLRRRPRPLSHRRPRRLARPRRTCLASDRSPANPK